MEVSKDIGYSFSRVYLYWQPRAPGYSGLHAGTAQVEVMGSRGRLSCNLAGICDGGDSTLVTTGQLPVVLTKGKTKDRTLLGYVEQRAGAGLKWAFSLDAEGPGGKGGLDYRLQVCLGLGKTAGRPGPVIMEGIVPLSYEARDTRVVGFDREAKARKNMTRGNGQNPLFQRVEPFDPPIANSIWWRLSIQPAFKANALQASYCPRQKKQRAAF